MPNPTLSQAQKKSLKQRAHHLKPVVLMGQAGLTEGVMHEIELALNHHELIKIKVTADDRVARQQVIESICSQLEASLIQSVGHIAVIYRKRPETD